MKDGERGCDGREGSGVRSREKKNKKKKREEKRREEERRSKNESNCDSG